MARHLISPRQDQLANQTLQRPAVGHETPGQIIEQLRMAGRLAQHAKIVDRRHDARAKQMMPDAIHHHPRHQRIVGRDQRLGQFQPAAPGAGLKLARCRQTLPAAGAEPLARRARIAANQAAARRRRCLRAWPGPGARLWESGRPIPPRPRETRPSTSPTARRAAARSALPHSRSGPRIEPRQQPIGQRRFVGRIAARRLAGRPTSSTARTKRPDSRGQLCRRLRRSAAGRAGRDPAARSGGGSGESITRRDRQGFVADGRKLDMQRDGRHSHSNRGRSIASHPASPFDLAFHSSSV